MRRRNGSLWAGLAMLGVTVSFGLVAVLDRAPAGPEKGAKLAPVGLDAPCGGYAATQSTVQELRAKEPYPVLVPAHALASQENLTGVWDCGADTIELAYSSGITVFEQVNSIADPLKAWEANAKADPSTTSVGTVLGEPALLVDALADPTGAPKGGVTVVVNGTWLVVKGNGQLPLADLIEVANSLGEPNIDPNATSGATSSPGATIGSG